MLQINLMIETAEISQQIATALYSNTKAHNMESNNIELESDEEKDV